MASPSTVTDAIAAIQLHDAPASSVSTNEQIFRFLKLAAEIRNRIYDYAAETPELGGTPRPGNGHYIGLTQVCRQIREEFRKIYLQQVPFTIRNEDVQGFTKAFFGLDRESRQVYKGQYPMHVHYLHPSFETVDLLPLLNVKMAFPQIKFTVLPHPEASNEDSYAWLVCDSITDVLVNTSPALIHDIQASKISEFCYHRDNRFYIWYKPGQELRGFDAIRELEGYTFMTELHKILGVIRGYDVQCNIAFDGIDVRNSNTSSRCIEKVE